MTGGKTIQAKIEELADKYADTLAAQFEKRSGEMKSDDKSHYLIYRVLGVSIEKGEAIDLYQNKGRFLYKYGGAFLEEAARLCFREAYPDAKSTRIPNTEGSSPKRFQVDLLVENDALEIKWRDATTDGDHVAKEGTRLKVIAAAGYHPVRVMFCSPIRENAKKIQDKLLKKYAQLGGDYYCGESAWEYVRTKTGIDLLAVLESIAERRSKDA